MKEMKWGRRNILCLFMVIFMAATYTGVLSSSNSVVFGADNVTNYPQIKQGITTDTVNVRTGPATSYSLVATYPKGTTFNAYGLVEADGSKWYKTTYGGQWAYLSADYAQIVGEETVTEAKYDPYKIGVTNSWTEVKGEPKATSPNITNLEPGRQMTIYSLVTSGAATWYKTTYGGQWVYVSTTTVTIKEEVQVTEEKYSPYRQGTATSPAPLRAAPNTANSVIATFDVGTQMTVYSYVTDGTNNWYKTTYGGQWAYMPANTVSLKEEPKPLTEEKYNPYKYGTTNSWTEVKASPSTSVPNVTNLEPGRQLTLYSYLTDGTTNWYKTTYGGQWAYVLAPKITLKEEPKPLTEEKYSPYKTGTANSPAPLRAAPNTANSVIATFDAGTQMTIYSYLTDGTNNWYKTTYGGQWAYVPTNTVALKEDTKPLTEEKYSPYKTGTATSGTPLRTAPNTANSVIATFDAGTQMTVYSYLTDGTNNWYKTTYGGQWAYVPANTVALKEDPKPLTEEKYSPYKTGTANSPAPLRAAPNTANSVIATFDTGTQMTIYSYLTDGTNKWYKTTYGGQWAYIPVSNITLKGEMVQEYYQPTKTGVIAKSTPARSQASGTASQVTTFDQGTQITVYSKLSNETEIWYKTTYGGQWVYVSGDSVTMSSTGVLTDSQFESYMTSQGFPESYKPQLRALHKAHPTWTFNAHNTGLQWSSVLSKMCTLGESLVEPTSPDSWKSKKPGAYNSSTGTYTEFDGRWNQASDQVVAYYLDPRNFLNEGSVYQFMDHRWTDGSATTNNIWNIVTKNNCFMNSRDYVYSLYNSGVNAGVNPTAITAMVVLEQGWRGTSDLISGKYPGYEGYYNHFNVGAYTANGMSSIERGLWYAKGSGTGATSFGRPWNSIEKSITGGATFYGNNYINQNQYTFYTKKFNVMNGQSNLGTHQYSTAIKAADDEGSILKIGYATDSENLTFWIPVYLGMPSTPPSLP